MQEKKTDSIVYAISAVFLSTVFLYFPSLVTESVTRSLSLCAYRVIPAVFPFSVLSSFFFYSEGAELFDRIMHRPFKAIFGLDSGASAFFSGLIFGFPLGALISGKLYESGKLTKAETERLITFGCCASPTFPVFAVGGGMYGSIKAGVILWASQAVISVLIGIFLHIFKPLIPESHTGIITENRKKMTLPDMLTSSVSDASRVMVNIIGSVTFFSLLGAVSSFFISEITKSEILPLFVSSIFEFTSACTSSAESYTYGAVNLQLSLAFSAFAIGFSGLSVIAQSASLFPIGKLSIMPLIKGKLLCGLLSSVSVYFLSDIIRDSVNVSVTSNTVSAKPIAPILSAALLICVIFCTSLKKQNRDLQKR